MVVMIIIIMDGQMLCSKGCHLFRLTQTCVIQAQYGFLLTNTLLTDNQTPVYLYPCILGVVQFKAFGFPNKKSLHTKLCLICKVIINQGVKTWSAFR